MRLHLRRSGHKPVALSPYLLRFWHNRLNYLLFSGRLKWVHLTHGPSPEIDFPVDGCYWPDPYVPRLHIDERCLTKGRFLNTLAHEMVHQYQHEHKLPLTHGRFFKAEAKRLAKHGLTI